MKPKARIMLNNLDGWMDDSGIRLRRMARELQNAGDDLSHVFSEMHTAVIACQESIQNLSAKLQAVRETDQALSGFWWDEPLTDAQISQLLGLNRRISDIYPLLRSVSEDVTPRMEAKLADQNDPMYDYEIEAILCFILREDDPDYDENDDNVLTTRKKFLKCLPSIEYESRDFAEPIGSAGLQAEPHCWLFHDLYDHEYGTQSPRLSFHDCLRIGRIYIDVQVWQQYDFDLTTDQAASDLDCDSHDRMSRG